MLKTIEETPSGSAGWTGLTRVYLDQNRLGTIVFEEPDLLASKGVVLVPENSLNTKVGNYAATLSRIQDSNGMKMVHLGWTDYNQHSYSLNVQKSNNASIDALKQLAEAIARNGS